MAAGGRRGRAPVEVRLTAIGLFVIGGVLVTLSLTAAGVLLSGLQVDPVQQGGTQYLDFVLFFNGVLCLLPFHVLVIVLGLRLLRGDRWAWLTTLALCLVMVTLVPLVVVMLPAPVVFAAVPAGCAVAFGALLSTPKARNWVAGET
jgi:hypothetical protein